MVGLLKTNLTSPDTITLHKSLHFLKKRKLNNVIIETFKPWFRSKKIT